MAIKGLSEKRKKQLKILLVVMTVIAAFSTVAYARYVKSSGKVEDKLSPAASVQPVIKENVRIEVGDTGYPVYVRAALIFNWKKPGEDGVLYFSTPSAIKPEEERDYELKLNQDNWVYNPSDGYYYYKNPVQSGGATEILIYSCTQLQNYHDDIRNEDYTLNLEIITQTVQALGRTDNDEYMAVEDAWGWKPTT